MADQKALINYEAAVTHHLGQRYGLGWIDACGDADLLERAIEEAQSPQDFVEWFAEKYGLTPLPAPTY